LLIDRSARPAAIVSAPPVVVTDWFGPEGGFEAFWLGEAVTVYVPDVQFGVVENWTVREPSVGILPPDSRMKRPITLGV
jgi:hypothetical protein